MEHSITNIIYTRYPKVINGTTFTGISVVTYALNEKILTNAQVNKLEKWASLIFSGRRIKEKMNDECTLINNIVHSLRGDYFEDLKIELEIAQRKRDAQEFLLKNNELLEKTHNFDAIIKSVERTIVKLEIGKSNHLSNRSDLIAKFKSLLASPPCSRSVILIESVFHEYSKSMQLESER